MSEQSLAGTPFPPVLLPVRGARTRPHRAVQHTLRRLIVQAGGYADLECHVPELYDWEATIMKQHPRCGAPSFMWSSGSQASCNNNYRPSNNCSPSSGGAPSGGNAMVLRLFQKRCASCCHSFRRTLAQTLLLPASCDPETWPFPERVKHHVHQPRNRGEFGAAGRKPCAEHDLRSTLRPKLSAKKLFKLIVMMPAPSCLLQNRKNLAPNFSTPCLRFSMHDSVDFKFLANARRHASSPLPVSRLVMALPQVGNS